MATNYLNKEIHQVIPLEERLLDKIRRREHVAQNTHRLHIESLTLGQRLADGLARVAGSWTFILSFLGFLGLWIIINSALLIFKHFDPYPFILLNLVLSCLAALQAPVIMMSQNRQEARDRLRSENDYAVNLKAEAEIEQLHQKLDILREQQWAELVILQNKQIEYLERLLQARGSRSAVPRKS
ncbi:MAG: DUF1003 domain-containing protein [Chloroflexi bacterium]|nr:DUF1003 domain-containing protein [Chloroflexota bacterium]